MDSGGGNASGVLQEGASSKGSNNQISCSRHTPQQIQYLETFFKDCAHPDGKQRKQIGRELGLEPCQIKFWFQNKRTLMKAQFERADNNSIRCKNERMKFENLAMKAALRNVLCPTCGGPSFSKDQGQSHNHIEKLQFENANLKKEYERAAAEVVKLTGKPVYEVNSWVFTGVPPVHLTFATSRYETISDAEKSVLKEFAVGAMDEFLKVIRSDKPLWTNNNGRYRLNRECYEKVFMRPRYLKNNITAKLESSKDCCVVPINAIVLVNMMLDPTMWLDLFPTLVTKTEILHAVETGTPGNRSGSLHLMHQVMHSLSPLVAPREFYFLRYCQQVQIDTWVIMDVSYAIPQQNGGNLMPQCWKLPSGCIIQDMPGGHSKVTWVELVEVDNRAFTHQLYRDLVTSGFVFGAERWIATLKQMCERAVLSNEVPANNTRATWSVEGKRSLMDLSHRMVKEFCATLNMPFNRLDFHNPSEADNSGIRVSTRKCTGPFLPKGIVICLATSLCLPLCPQHVFAFFQDNKMRYQWDFFCHGNPVKEIARASSGHHPGNSISVFQPEVDDESHFAILQESFVDLLGYYLVFAPLELTAINMVITGLSSSNTFVLPSGFVITGDGRGNDPTNKFSKEDGSSLLTVTFQILLSNAAYTRQKHMEVVADANCLINSTVEKIKAALSPGRSDKTTIPSASTASPL
ncbi:hypothetical protein QQ045_021688 [Rhodiola kirilowii]